MLLFPCELVEIKYLVFRHNHKGQKEHIENVLKRHTTTTRLLNGKRGRVIFHVKRHTNIVLIIPYLLKFTQTVNARTASSTLIK